MTQSLVSADRHALLIGSKTPTGSDLYAKTGAGPKVFLISSFLESTFNRTTFDLRDKSALNVDRDAADRVEIVAGTHSMKFAKKDGQWRITEPAVWLPSASGTMPAPTAAAEPLDEPPGVCSALCGLRVLPGLK